MDSHEDQLIICLAEECIYYKDYAKGCVYRDIFLDYQGRCQDYEEGEKEE